MSKIKIIPPDWLHTGDNLPELGLRHIPTDIPRKTWPEDQEEQAAYIRSLFDEGTMRVQEQMIALFLDIDEKALGFIRWAKGTKTEVACDYKILFTYAFLANAEGIVIAHNHPGDNPTASEPDIEVARQTKTIARFFEMDLLEAFVITEERHMSIYSTGLI